MVATEKLIAYKVFKVEQNCQIYYAQVNSLLHKFPDFQYSALF